MQKCFILLVCFFCFIVNAEVQKYSIVKVNDTSIGKIRIRGQVFIVSPEAISQKDRAETSMQAAIDVVKQTGADAVTIFLIPNDKFIGSGYNLAVTNFFVDGCGYSGKECNKQMCDVQASKTKLTKLQLQIAEETFNPPKKVLDQYGLPDEKKLQKYIAGKLKINVSDIEKNFIYPELEQINQ